MSTEQIQSALDAKVKMHIGSLTVANMGLQAENEALRAELARLQAAAAPADQASRAPSGTSP